MGDFCDVCDPAEHGLQPFRFFIENAKESCQSCQTIVSTLKYFYPPSGPKLKVLLYPEDFQPGTPSLLLSDPNDEVAPSSIVFYATNALDSRITAQLVGKYFKTIYTSRDLQASPSGSISLGQIKEWDRTCCESHPKCVLASPRLPARVIDIRPKVGECQLYETNGEYENYITLSHCWGSLKILTTTKKNLELHKKTIVFAALPKTFQDAIEVTRSIGIRYLWIDSLCIIQDDIDDWARESSKMASIYHNSYLTLAATCAKDGSEGLFKPREAEICRIELTDPRNPGVAVSLRARRSRKHNCFQTFHEDIWENVESEPLIARAWVYQERLLSRRLLHFASDEMVWECQTTASCECNILPKDEAIAKSRRMRGDMDEGGMSDRSVFEALSLAREKKVETDEETQRWYQLIKSYTFLNITNDEDRLPAFSGISSTLIKADDYMAGIRKDNAVRDLLWFAVSSTNPRRSRDLLAPSWSWASIIGGVGHRTTMYNYPTQWDESSTKILLEITDINTVRLTSDPFGRVKGGQLKARGRCVEGLISERDKKDWIGTGWGAHRLQLEISSHSNTSNWITELSIDTIEDARIFSSKKGTSVSLLAVWLTEKAVHFLILLKKSPFSRKLRRIGLAIINVGDLVKGTFDESTAEELFGKSQHSEFTIV